MTALPLAEIHATRDEFVPLPEIQRVMAAAGEPKRMWVVEAANHRFSDNLDEFDRQLVRLKLAGHGSAESATILGREPAFVRMRWSRLRQHLRDRGFTQE